MALTSSTTSITDIAAIAFKISSLDRAITQSPDR
jgi:hypothetical protein